MYRYISHGHGFNPQIKHHHPSSVPLAEIVSRLSRMAAKSQAAPGGIHLISSVASKKGSVVGNFYFFNLKMKKVSSYIFTA